MISVIVPLLVMAAFCVAIVSIWMSKPINKGGIFHDAGYDEKHPPSPEEWRGVKVKYTILLVFLGAMFTVLAFLSLSGTSS